MTPTVANSNGLECRRLFHDAAGFFYRLQVTGKKEMKHLEVMY